MLESFNDFRIVFFKDKVPFVVFKLTTDTFLNTWIVRNEFPLRGVGPSDGAIEGTLDGAHDGLFEGFTVGLMEGLIVGLVGTVVGLSEGEVVYRKGAADGYFLTFVGFIVGFLEFTTGALVTGFLVGYL